jgi:hypothetical protein
MCVSSLPALAGGGLAYRILPRLYGSRVAGSESILGVLLLRACSGTAIIGAAAPMRLAVSARISRARVILRRALLNLRAVRLIQPAALLILARVGLIDRRAVAILSLTGRINARDIRRRLSGSVMRRGAEALHDASIAAVAAGLPDPASGPAHPRPCSATNCGGRFSHRAGAAQLRVRYPYYTIRTGSRFGTVSFRENAHKRHSGVTHDAN